MLGVRPDFASEGVILGVSGPLKYTHTQPFNGITRVGWYQKKYSCPLKYITLYKQQTPQQPVFTPSVNWGGSGLPPVTWFLAPTRAQKPNTSQSVQPFLQGLE